MVFKKLNQIFNVGANNCTKIIAIQILTFNNEKKHKIRNFKRILQIIESTAFVKSFQIFNKLKSKTSMKPYWHNKHKT
jgi:hypothetical protein